MGFYGKVEQSQGLTLAQLEDLHSWQPQVIRPRHRLTDGALRDGSVGHHLHLQGGCDSGLLTTWQLLLQGQPGKLLSPAEQLTVGWSARFCCC